MENKPHSIHTFMWPFRWTGAALGDLENKLDKERWKPKMFEVKSSEHYNEYVYFHSFVRDILYSTEKNEKNVRYFEYQLDKDSRFEFKADGTEIKLRLKGISLHAFFTGVGILTFQLENDQRNDIEFIKLINDFGRRTYPQFLGKDGTEQTKYTFLPEYVKVSYAAEENFSRYDCRDCFDMDNVIQPPRYITALFNENFSFSKNEPQKIRITHLSDDRMYTICWYGNNHWSWIFTMKKNESKYYRFGSSYEFNYLANANWYELIFCDGKSCTCQSPVMLHDHLKKYTYDRWINYGTLYGITRDCLFCLTNEWESLIKNYADFIPVHIQTIYYQMAILCLAQRASINKFSYDLSEILKPDGPTRAVSLCEKKLEIERASLLQELYLKFNNQMYFREVTAQIQGIEIYQMMQQAMGIESEANQLDREIEELHNLLDMENAKVLNTEANNLSKIANLFLPATFIAALFALFSDNIDFSKAISVGKLLAVFSLVILAILCVIFHRSIRKFIKKISQKDV